jgi:hypothetical protein
LSCRNWDTVPKNGEAGVLCGRNEHIGDGGVSGVVGVSVEWVCVEQYCGKEKSREDRE